MPHKNTCPKAKPQVSEIENYVSKSVWSKRRCNIHYAL